MQATTLEMRLNGLCCPNCAGKIQDQAGKLPGVTDAEVFFATQKMRVELSPGADEAQVVGQIHTIVRQIEPDVQVSPWKSKEPEAMEGQHCDCGHDHGAAHKDAQDHGHSHNHAASEGWSVRNILLLVAMALFAVGFFLSGPIKIAVYVISYALAGYDVLWKAATGIRRGSFFDENLLMGIASLAAMILGEYAEGVAVMLFYQVGEFFQARAVGKSRKSIESLLDIRPQNAWLLEEEIVREVPAEQVAVGQRIQVRPGERVPLDGIVLKGQAAIDTSALTGESLPRQVVPGENVMSGAVALDGMLEIEVHSAYSDTTVARILHMVEEASEKKAPTEQFITKFARYYTPAVVLLAALLAIIPPLFMPGAEWSDWIYRAMTFLVVSCPCALVISVPLSYMAGIGAASRAGVLVKGAGALDALREVRAMAMDKTGTLTLGQFHVSGVVPEPGITPEELRYAAAVAEQRSNHPIALAVVKAAGQDPLPALEDASEISGKGVVAKQGGSTYLAGNEALMAEHGLQVRAPKEAAGSLVFVAKDEQYLGYLLVADELKKDVAQSIAQIRAEGIDRLVLLTGDSETVARDVAAQVGIEEVHAQLLPGDKLRLLEEMQQGSGRKVAFVGDGINDAPVLAQADVGIAMGGLGADAAIEAADVVLMADEPRTIVSALRIAGSTRRIVMQNIVFALAVKAVVLVLSAMGLANMWAAVFADVGVTLLAILNAMRALKAK